ncbi:hypothetical protein Lal_00001583 [Lupinus albus]|uniref:Uncharacterized protein n=1 Tax=Lupinus albus TaxID=3870 RepID=A0A6A5P939_LUPAL|nr:hypothetical protein Lalb_Chr11g0062261 [Lupinus albus]KAF1893149.1 hypothetical protein Lal_00001583 [Lupinus albus]
MANANEITNNVKSFPWKQTLEIIMLFFNLFAILWFSSHSPITLQAFWFSYNQLIFLFNNSFYTFLLLNAILLSLYAFSHTQNGDVSSLSDYSNDFYNEYLNLSDYRFKITENETEDYKPVTCSDQVMDEKTVTTAVTETTTTMTVSTKTSGEKVSEKKCYQRIQSESVERRRMVAEFNRYNSSCRKRSCHVERLSKDDFNRAVEDFIAKQKRILWEEQRETEKTKYSGLIQ